MLLQLLTIILTPLLTFLGVLISEKYRYKGKLAEVNTFEIAKVKEELNERMDHVTEKLDEIQREQLRTSLTITQLQSDVQKHNSVVERTYKLERDMAIVKTKLDLRQA